MGIGQIPEEVLALAETAREFSDAVDDYTQKINFYRDHVRDYEDLKENDSFETEDAGEYWKKVRDDLKQQAERVQNLGRKLHQMQQDFEPDEYLSERFREVQGINYQGTEQIQTVIQEAYSDLHLLEEEAIFRGIHRDLIPNTEKMRESEEERELREGFREAERELTEPGDKKERGLNEENSGSRPEDNPNPQSEDQEKGPYHAKFDGCENDRYRSKIQKNNKNNNEETEKSAIDDSDVGSLLES